MEIDNIEKSILQKMIFSESFENLLNDCSKIAPANVVKDILKMLLHHKLVVATPIGKVQKSGFMFDSDNMQCYTYRITAKGLKKLES